MERASGAGVTRVSGFQPRAGKPVKSELLERQPWDAGNLVRTFFSGQLFPFLCVLARGLLRLKGGLRFFVLFFLFLNGWVLALKVSYFTIPNAGALLRNIFSSLPAVPLSCLFFSNFDDTWRRYFSKKKELWDMLATTLVGWEKGRSRHLDS